MMPIDHEPIFKTCPMCKKEWKSREIFLDDQELIFIGYQANLGLPEEGLFYFTHEIEECGSTMAIKVEYFLTLYTGERYTEDKKHADDCRGYCLNREELRRCDARCRYAYVREISHVIMDRMTRDFSSITGE